MTRTTLLDRGSRVSFVQLSEFGIRNCFVFLICSRSSAWGSSVSKKPRTEAGETRNGPGSSGLRGVSWLEYTPPHCTRSRVPVRRLGQNKKKHSRYSKGTKREARVGLGSSDGF